MERGATQITHQPPMWRHAEGLGYNVPGEIAMSTVLIVEDDQEIRELIGDVLALEGYSVHSLARLAHGLDRIRKIKPDVIVLDLGLPGIGGIELLRIIKADPTLGSIPVVICSGAVETIQQHRDEFAELDIPVVRKPFNLDQLLAAVKNPTLAARDS